MVGCVGRYALISAARPHFRPPKIWCKAIQAALHKSNTSLRKSLAALGDTALANGRRPAMLRAMKPHRPTVSVFLAALLLGLAAALPAQYAPMKPAYPAPPPAAPAAPAAKDGKDGKKDDATPPKIEGLALARSDGRWLGLEVDSSQHFVLHFYNKDKKPEKPDVARASARWQPIGKAGELRTVLNPSGNALAAPLFVSPPLKFTVYLTLLTADDKVVESLVADLRGL
jgi:hypothetical protein